MHMRIEKADATCIAQPVHMSGEGHTNEQDKQVQHARNWLIYACTVPQLAQCTAVLC